MDPAPPGLDMTATNDGGKVKKTRKRGRMGSCIPCTKRRQKCDRTQPCSSCVRRGAPALCKWESFPDGPSPLRSPHLELDPSAEGAEGAEDGNMNEDEIPPALRTTKLDLNENRERLKMLSKRISSLESRVVSTAGPASAPTTVGPRSPLMSLDAMGASSMGFGGATKVEGVYQPGNFGSGGTSGVPGMVGGYDYVASAPILTGAGPLLEASPVASIASPSTHSPQIYVPARPQASRRQSEVGFRVPSAPQDDSHRRTVPFSLFQPGEFVGRGNTSYTLHSIRSFSPFRLPQARPTAPTSLLISHVIPAAQTLIPTPEIQHLIQYIPSMQSGNLMIDAFFKEVNWRYGLPEKWFSTTSSQMWTDLQNTSRSHQLNPYWLCLFFSALACAPQLSPEASTPNARPPNTYDSHTYYICATVARRIAEDNYFGLSNTLLVPGTPHSSPADGCVLGCLAIPLLCDFLTERGSVSEAWKLMGYGTRIAQSIGLHRDPANPVWQDMPEEVKDLRRRAWWGLYIWDRLLSYILGRPQMIRGDNCDVAKPLSVDGKGRKNSFDLSRVVMIQLADVVSEVLDKCTSAEYPTWATFTEMDAKFEAWELAIPAEFGPNTTPEQDIILFVGLSPQEIQRFARHRYMIITWYRLARLKLYTITIKQHQPTTLTTTRVESPGPIRDCAEKCVRLALELIKYQCGTFDRMRRTKPVEGLGENWYFEGCLSLFEAAVALLLVLTRFQTTFFAPPGANMPTEIPKGLKLDYDEITRVISRVVDVFSEVVMSEKGFDNGSGEVKEGQRAEIASKALDSLQVLLKEHWWKLDPRSEKGRPIQGIGPTQATSSSAQPSPQRTGSSPATGMVGSASGFPFPSTGYGGPVFPSQQPLLTFASIQHPGPVQSYPALASPTAAESNPSPSSMQQFRHQMQTSVYGSTAQYPMTTAMYPSSVIQSPFNNPPLPAGNSYPPFASNQGSEPSSMPAPNTPHTPNPSAYEYQPQNYFSTVDSSPPLTSPFPFTPISSHNSTQSLNQIQNKLYQSPDLNQQYRMSPRYQPPFQSTSSAQPLPLPLPPNPAAAAAYTYNPTPYTTSASTSTGNVRPLRTSPGAPPPSQGMKMIHYVAPGSTTTSQTTASGMGILGGSGVGTMSFTVSGISQDSSRQQKQQQQQQHTPPQESTIVLSEFMGSAASTGSPGDRTGGGSGSGGPSGAYM